VVRNDAKDLISEWLANKLCRVIGNKTTAIITRSKERKEAIQVARSRSEHISIRWGRWRVVPVYKRRQAED